MNEPAVLPLKVQQAAIQHSIDQAKVNFEKNKELSNLLEEIGEKRAKEINQLLGSKIKEYREFLEKRREIARTMQPLLTATPEGRKIKSQFQRTGLDESNKLIKSLGINVNDFKSIISKYQKESRSIIEKTRAIEGSLNLEVGSIPAEVIHPEPNSPWHSFHPPYTFSLGDAYTLHSGSAGGFVPYVHHYENYLTGEILSHTQNFIHEPTDHAQQMTVGSSNIFIYFQMPASGQLNIWSQLQCVESSYYGFTSCDWPTFQHCEASITNSSRYHIMVGDPPGNEEAYLRLFDDFRHISNEDVEWSGNIAMPGEYRTFNLITDITYSAGQWIRMATGIYDVQDAVVDDMAYFSEIKNSWILRGVWVSAISP